MNAVHSEFIDATASTGSALLLTSFDDAELPELVEGPGDVPTTYADATALERGPEGQVPVSRIIGVSNNQ